MRPNRAESSSGDRRRETSTRGFTLVELLVVVGIIAVLIALLMPALMKARDRSVRIACASNLHQIAIACMSYAVDWRGCFPPTSAIGEFGDDCHLIWGYNVTISKSDYAQLAPLLKGYQARGHGTYLPNASALMCPGTEVAAPQYYDLAGFRSNFENPSGTWYSGYVFNPFRDPKPSANIRRHLIFAADVSSTMFSSAIQWKVHNHAGNYDRPPGYNILFFDGSVHWFNDINHQYVNDTWANNFISYMPFWNIKTDIVP